jgi:protein MPE1
MKRFVRVTGIPRSFLQTVETPLSGEGSSGGAMLTADGGFVRAVPDQRQWQKQAAVKTRNEGSGDDDALIEKDLTCGLCKKLVRDAVRTQCCDHAYCEECIESYLLEHDFECPNCESKIPSLAKLVPATDLRERAAAFLEEKKKKGGEAEAEEESASASAGDVKVSWEQKLSTRQREN